MRGKGDDGTQPDLAAIPPKRLDRRLDAIKRIAHARQQPLAVLGQRNAAADLAHQRHAEALFQFRNPVRQRRAGDAKLFGGLGQGAERCEQRQRGQGARRGLQRLSHGSIPDIDW